MVIQSSKNIFTDLSNIEEKIRRLEMALECNPLNSEDLAELVFLYLSKSA